MRHKTLLVWAYCLLCSPALADEDNENNGLRANFRRVALEMSSTSVSHAEQYQNSPNTQLSSDSETLFKGVFDFILEYEQPDYQWNNAVYMEYGKTRLKKADGSTTSSENADKILLTSDYARKMWKYGEADVGPFGSLGYQTEFTANNDAPRNKTLRSKGGLKLFNGQYIKELYVAAVEELDMTYSRSDTKTAYEIGIRAEYPLRDGIKFQLESYFRDYFLYSRYVGTDFKYEFNLTGRMDVKIHKDLSIAPYVSYFEARSREASAAGSNFMIGLSFAYADIFNL